MQTFLPYPAFRLSARALDCRRLGIQRVEVYQILCTLLGESEEWRGHPAVLMWEGHEIALYGYALTICTEWLGRGYQDTTSEALRSLLERHRDEIDVLAPPPSWLGSEAFHASHRSNLLRKDPEFYGRHGWVEPADLPYVWPTKSTNRAATFAAWHHVGMSPSTPARSHPRSRGPRTEQSPSP